ncbi:MAG: hypothetical protein JRJ12_07450 [Deltaproteobacteria bacterium]|nr:hypothetical protein [Deltaproteobacteria bacterium]MBW2071291.1 hypothetical protein [Deltaproteobacteria bacterium]
MKRTASPLLGEFLDDSLPLPDICWETVPAGVTLHDAWQSFDENIAGWVPVWFPTHDPLSGRAYGEFERASLFEDGLRQALVAMHRWPLWGTATQKKQAVAVALLHLCCQVRAETNCGFCG